MALSTALKSMLARALHGIGLAEEFATAVDNSTSTLDGATTADLTKLHALTATAAELNTNAGVSAGTVTASKEVVAGANKQLDTVAVATLVSGADATPGAAGQATTIVNRKTAVADTVATAVIRVTCPNAEHGAIVELLVLATVKKTAGGTYESSRVGVGMAVFDRTTGAALVGAVQAAGALTNPAIATSGTDTLTMVYGVAAVSGAVGATNTMDITITCTASGTDTHDVVVLATILNQAASGMTLSAL